MRGLRLGRRRRRRPARPGLLARFAIISFVLLLAVGLVLGRWLGEMQRERVLDDGRANASIVVETGVQPLLDPTDFATDFRPIDPATRSQLDDTIGRAVSPDGVVRLKIWNGQRWIIWSDNPRLVGRWFAGDPALDRALAGEPTSLITDLRRPEELEERDFGQLLAVYVPIRVDPATAQFSNDGTGEVVGAFEIYVPYAPIAAALRDDLRTLYLSLGIGLVVLYLALFHLVAGASRRLRAQAVVNEHQATHDLLTELPNRRRLVGELQRMLDRRPASKYVALALLDIDHFKEINDALGHPSGDAVLQAIAERFREHLPDTVVARIGGDEFAVAAGDLPHAQAALALSTRLEAALHDPFEVAGISVSVRPSIGIALGPDDGQTADELLQHADVAMYVAKRSGTVRKLYSRSLDHYSPDRLALAGELRDAIARADGDVHVAFQPKLDLLTDEIPGVECLVRWKHPERGFVPPAEFLPIIENTELIAPLTWLVLDQALATCASWRRHGLELQVAVNISARTIGQPELYDRVVATLGRYELPPSALELELTESALLGDQHDAAANVSRLRELGVSIAIDDFGTGYASVGYLTTMPISGLKVDRSFVERMFDDDASSAVIDFSIGLGRQLGLQIVAEGVEDERTLEELRRRGCHAAQGYFISRPMGANEFLHWLLAWSTRHLSPRDIIGGAGRDVRLADAGASPASPYVTSAHRTSPYATGPFRSGVAAMDTDAGQAGDTESCDPGDVWDAAGPYELAGVASTPSLSGAGTVTTVLPVVTPTPGSTTTPGQAPTALHTVEPVSALSPVPPLASVPTPTSVPTLTSVATLSPVPALSPAPATASSVPTAVAPRFSLRLPPPSVEGPVGGPQPPSVEGER